MTTFPESPQPVSTPETSDALARRFGDRWDVSCDPYRRLWSAERRQGRQLRLLCAHAPAELAAKIEAAEREAGPPGRDSFRWLQALEDALRWRRARVAGPCPDCDATPGARCEDHSRDVDLIGEYERAARQLGAGS